MIRLTKYKVDKGHSTPVLIIKDYETKTSELLVPASNEKLFPYTTANILKVTSTFIRPSHILMYTPRNIQKYEVLPHRPYV